MKTTITIFHADSLAGPMRECKKAFEERSPDVDIALVSGRSKELAEQIQQGKTCDIAAFSDPRVIHLDLIEKELASWSIVFSTNQMVIITQQGNEQGISGIADLLRPEVRVVRVTGERDLATARTITCLERAGAGAIVKKTAVHAGTIPEAIQTIQEGRADAGIVYLSAALPYSREFNIISLPPTINLNDQIQNAVTIPHTSRNKVQAITYIQFLLSETGRKILEKAGQPPQIPLITHGVLPAEFVSK